jgi:hypothetical protein
MHDLGGCSARFAPVGQKLRSSVASKRFLLRDERLARFRFARVVFRAGQQMGLS